MDTRGSLIGKTGSRYFFKSITKLSNYIIILVRRYLFLCIFSRENFQAEFSWMDETEILGNIRPSVSLQSKLNHKLVV